MLGAEGFWTAPAGVLTLAITVEAGAEILLFRDPHLQRLRRAGERI
ncbi:hypothetical protein [Streptomyces aureus]|nr:hypothetical protein [Streptomyces aureus]